MDLPSTGGPASDPDSILDYCTTQCFYDNVIEADPNNPDAMHQLGGAYLLGGRIAALVLPGVTAVLTAADLPCFPELPPPSAVMSMTAPASSMRSRNDSAPCRVMAAERSSRAALPFHRSTRLWPGRLPA